MFVLLEASRAFDQLASLGAAGLMGAMWLWERRTSQKREQQIDESHARIVSDRLQLEQLIDVVRRNTDVMSRLCATQEQLVREITTRGQRATENTSC
jgi:hypothetical protein